MLRAAHIITLLLPALLLIGRGLADTAFSCVALLFIAWSVQSRSAAWLKQPDVVMALGLWVIVVVSCLAMAYQPDLVNVLAWIRFPLGYAALRYWVLADPVRLRDFALSAMAVGAVAGVDSLYQYVTGTSLSGHPLFDGRRLTGPLSHPNIGNYYVKLLFPVLGIMVYRYFQMQKRGGLIGVLLGVLLVSGLVFITGERSVSLLLIGGLGIMAIGTATFFPGLRRYVVAGGILFVLLAAGLVFTQQSVYLRAYKIITDVQNFWDTPYGQLYTASLILWQQHALMGIGANAFFQECPGLMLQGLITFCDVHSHNIHLQVLTEMGLVGYACFVILICVLFSQLRELLSGADGYAKLLPLSALALVSIIFFPFIVTQSLFSNWPALLMWISLGSAMAGADMAGQRKKIPD